MNEWIRLSSFNRTTTTLLDKDRHAADEWSRIDWLRWNLEGIEPADRPRRRAFGLVNRPDRGVKALHKPSRPDMG